MLAMDWMRLRNTPTRVEKGRHLGCRLAPSLFSSLVILMTSVAVGDLLEVARRLANYFRFPS